MTSFVQATRKTTATSLNAKPEKMPSAMRTMGIDARSNEVCSESPNTRAEKYMRIPRTTVLHTSIRKVIFISPVKSQHQLACGQRHADSTERESRRPSERGRADAQLLAAHRHVLVQHEACRLAPSERKTSLVALDIGLNHHLTELLQIR